MEDGRWKMEDENMRRWKMEAWKVARVARKPNWS
jgi:hypothetical protein